MKNLKIMKNQEIVLENFVTLRNATSEVIFGFQNNVLFNYFDCTHIKPSDHIKYSLCQLLGHELIKYFALKIPGGIFSISQIGSPPTDYEKLLSMDVSNDDEENNFILRIFSNYTFMKEIKHHILDNSILNLVPKVTGLSELKSKMSIQDKNYEISLLENVRTLKTRELLLKCSYIIEGKDVDFYFTEKIVNHFCTHVLAFSNEKILPFHLSLGKIFSNLFLEYLKTKCNIFAKKIDVELQYIKNKEFLEFHLNSEHHASQFFVETKHKLLLIKLLSFLQLKPITLADDKLNLKSLKIPFPMEVGVVYLNEQEFRGLNEGDILVFDKTCLSPGMTNIEKCMLDFNGIQAVVQFNDERCEISHFTKDW